MPSLRASCRCSAASASAATWVLPCAAACVSSPISGRAAPGRGSRRRRCRRRRRCHAVWAVKMLPSVACCRQDGQQARSAARAGLAVQGSSTGRRGGASRGALGAPAAPGAGPAPAAPRTWCAAAAAPAGAASRARPRRRRRAVASRPPARLARAARRHQGRTPSPPHSVRAGAAGDTQRGGPCPSNPARTACRDRLGAHRQREASSAQHRHAGRRPAVWLAAPPIRKAWQL